MPAAGLHAQLWTALALWPFFGLPAPRTPPGDRPPLICALFALSLYAKRGWKGFGKWDWEGQEVGVQGAKIKLVSLVPGQSIKKIVKEKK